MCLILLALRSHPDTDLLLAGNRDEFYARPSADPALLPGSPRIFAGRDLEAGGTWLGRNEHGIIAALTNRRDAAPPPPQALSRGSLVLDVLGCRDPEQALARLQALDIERYRPFNLLFGTPRAFYTFASWDGCPPRELEPGFYALSNSSLDDRTWPKVDLCHDLWQRQRQRPGEDLLRGVQAFLCDPAPHPRPAAAGGRATGEAALLEAHGALGAVFVQTEIYGTVSASIVAGGGRLGARYYFARAAAMRVAQAGWAAHPQASGLPSEAGNPFQRLALPFSA